MFCCNDYSSVARVRPFSNLFFNVSSISIQSYAEAGSSNITKLPILMPMVYQDFVFAKEKEIGRREERKGKEFMVNRVGIRMELRTKIKILSISSVETSVPIEKTLICKKN
jgi:hypothetical protein